MKIEIISGSPRINSVTRRVAMHLKNQIKETTEHEVDIIDMKDWTIPPVQSVWVSVDKASPGAMGGMRASQQLLQLVPALFGIASPYLLITPAVDKKFNEHGELIDESFQNAVHNFITEFFWLAEKLVEEKVSI